MARVGDEFFDEDAIVAKARLRFRAGASETVSDLFAAVRDPHALAAAAGGSLDHDRIADLVGDPGGLFFVLDHAKVAGHG